MCLLDSLVANKVGPGVPKLSVTGTVKFEERVIGMEFRIRIWMLWSDPDRFFLNEVGSSFQYFIDRSDNNLAKNQKNTNINPSHDLPAGTVS